MESEWTQLVRQLAEGARRRVAEEEKRIDAIIAAHKQSESPQPKSR
jgi:hypothetical protein